MAGHSGRLLLVTLSLGCAQSPPSVGRVTLPPTSNSDVAAESTPAQGRPPQDCGERRSFDSDGDGISNPVERNNGQNRYADLANGRCDPDPSRSTGRPHAGAIEGGLNLPDVGPGYRHFRGSDPVDHDDWGSLALLTCIESVGRALRRQNIRLDIGDLSLRGGGRFPPHASHQNGRDVDLRYIRKDRRLSPLDLRFQPDEYDPGATRDMIETFFEKCNVELMFADVERLRFDVRDRPILPAAGHSNHLHVRIEGSRE
ncbi:MAG: penicillin-insensitive murein endopeptidase [Myxococcota bacterium]